MRGHTVGGRYRLESVLGRGGMATVWLAEDQLLGRWVALKRGSGETLNEARVAARLSHPGVVRVLDLVADGDRPWIVMEALSRATLYAAVEGRSPFDRGDLFATVLAVSEATPAPFRHAGPLQPVIEGLLRVDPGERWTLTRTREALQARALYSGRGRHARA